MARAALVAALILGGCASDPLSQVKSAARRDFTKACMAHHNPAPELYIAYFDHCMKLAQQRIR